MVPACSAATIFEALSGSSGWGVGTSSVGDGTSPVAAGEPTGALPAGVVVGGAATVQPLTMRSAAIAAASNAGRRVPAIDTVDRTRPPPAPACKSASGPPACDPVTCASVPSRPSPLTALEPLTPPSAAGH